MKNSFFSLAYMLWILACGSGGVGSADRSGPENKSVAPAMEENLSGGNQQAPGTVEVKEQKIIRNGSMSISVKNAKETRDALITILEKNKAYVGNEQLNNTDYQTVYTVQIRVPAGQLDPLVSDIEALTGTVTFKSIEARDVTEEYIDLETRLTNKRAYLEQYRTLLKTARSMEDILKVQEQIRQLEEEIESVTGRLKYLTNQVDLSTLELTIMEMKDYVYRPDRRINFWERFKESISSGWYVFVNFCLQLLGAWPFFILIALFVWLALRFGKRKKHVPPAPPSPPTPKG